MTEDITFCQNGWEECQVTRCERHPSNIKNPQLPHSYAKLYRTEYCPLEKPQPIDVVEVVRCKDCKHWHREIHNGIEYFNYNSCDLNHGGDGHDFYCTDGEEVK